MGIKAKILIAEHDPIDLELLEYQLKLSRIDYVSEVVQNELDYRNAIKNFIPDIILSDYTFPSFAEQENRVKAELLNTIGQAVIASDLNGIISCWNKAAEKTYGWTAEEAIGNNVLHLIPSQQTKEQAEEIMNELYQGHSWSGELIMQRKNGTTFTALITHSPVYDSKHKLSGIIGISSDLTERIKNEEKLNKANRLYSFISHINKTITHVQDEQSLFKEACRIACDQGKFKIAWGDSRLPLFLSCL